MGWWDKPSETKGFKISACRKKLQFEDWSQWNECHDANCSKQTEQVIQRLCAGDQPWLIQGIRSGDGVGEDQETIA